MDIISKNTEGARRQYACYSLKGRYLQGLMINLKLIYNQNFILASTTVVSWQR